MVIVAGIAAVFPQATSSYTINQLGNRPVTVNGVPTTEHDGRTTLESRGADGAGGRTVRRTVSNPTITNTETITPFSAAASFSAVVTLRNTATIQTTESVFLSSSRTTNSTRTTTAWTSASTTHSTADSTITLVSTNATQTIVSRVSAPGVQVTRTTIGPDSNASTTYRSSNNIITRQSLYAREQQIAWIVTQPVTNMGIGNEAMFTSVATTFVSTTRGESFAWSSVAISDVEGQDLGVESVAFGAQTQTYRALVTSVSAISSPVTSILPHGAEALNQIVMTTQQSTYTVHSTVGAFEFIGVEGEGEDEVLIYEEVPVQLLLGVDRSVVTVTRATTALSHFPAFYGSLGYDTLIPGRDTFTFKTVAIIPGVNPTAALSEGQELISGYTSEGNAVFTVPASDEQNFGRIAVEQTFSRFEQINMAPRGFMTNSSEIERSITLNGTTVANVTTAKQYRHASVLMPGSFAHYTVSRDSLTYTRSTLSDGQSAKITSSTTLEAQGPPATVTSRASSENSRTFTRLLFGQKPGPFFPTIFTTESPGIFGNADPFGSYGFAAVGPLKIGSLSSQFTGGSSWSGTTSAFNRVFVPLLITRDTDNRDITRSQQRNFTDLIFQQP